jgi:hypothetical protein
LIKVTTNREDFSKHGLHLNSKGKEKVSTELLKHLLTIHKKQETAAIYLPWKSESVVKDTRTIKIATPNEVPNISIDAEDSKVSGILNNQQGDNHVTCKNPTTTTKEISRNLKLQRNCPKVSNDDLLWS